MTKVVMDASAVLAYLNEEPGVAEVLSYLPGAIISAVNAAEVAGKLAEDGVLENTPDDFIARMALKVVSFERGDVAATAQLRPITRHARLSLGDRACLALAARLKAPALTGDRRWADLDLGVDVRLIR